jgi:predicted P-loop ATPase
MKTVTIILGEQGLGKTTRALEMVDKVPFYITYDVNVPNYFFDMHTVIFDEMQLKDLQKLKKIITSKTITYRKPYAKELTTIEMPNIIIISNTLQKSDFEDVREMVVFNVSHKLK